MNMNFFAAFWNQKWVVSLTAGVLLGLSYSPFPFPFTLLVFPGVIWLFRLLELTHSAREMALVSYVGLVLWNLITTYWLMFATVAGGIAAILANAAIMTLPLMLIHRLHSRNLPALLTALMVPSIWLVYEFLHFRWELAWPWLSLGNSFATAPWLVQYIQFTGMLGITFWIVLAGWMLFRRSSRVALALILLVPPSLSLVMYATNTHDTEEHVEVAVMQPNYDSYLPNAGYPNAMEPLRELLAYSNEVKSAQTRAVFWPENAIMQLIRYDFPNDATIEIYREVFNWGVPLISGTSFLYTYPPGEEPAVVRGEYAGNKFNIYNAALGFYPNRTMDYYLKPKLVPMVERIPYVHTLSRLDRFGWVDWSNLAMYGRGERRSMFNVWGNLTAVAICYDSVFPDWIRGFVNDGARFIVVVTNDGWWGNTSGHIQHFEFARLRAVETGRTVLRSANNGLSGAILPNGDVALKTEYWTRDHFLFDVPLYDHKTFYVRYGDWIGYPALALSLLALFMQSAKVRRLFGLG